MDLGHQSDGMQVMIWHMDEARGGVVIESMVFWVVVSSVLWVIGVGGDEQEGFGHIVLGTINHVWQLMWQLKQL